MMFFKLPGTVLLFFIYFFFVSPILMAQDSLAVELPAQWSLQQCFDYAMKNNIQLNSLRLSHLSSGQDLLLSRRRSCRTSPGLPPSRSTAGKHSLMEAIRLIKYTPPGTIPLIQM